MLVAAFIDFCQECLHLRVRALARHGMGGMWLITAIHASLGSWTGQAQAQAQVVEWDAVSLFSQPVNPQQARLVVYRTADDELPEQATVRINGRYLANLQRATFAVVCLPAQPVVLSLSERAVDASLEPIAVSVPLMAGEVRYILASDAPGQALVMYGLPAEYARLDLLAGPVSVRTRSRFKSVQPCLSEQASGRGIQLMEAAHRAVDSKRQ